MDAEGRRAVSDTTEHSWPEQEAIEKWWRDHSLELKQAASKYRIEETERLLGENALLCERSIENEQVMKWVFTNVKRCFQDPRGEYWVEWSTGEPQEMMHDDGPADRHRRTHGPNPVLALLRAYHKAVK